MSAKWLPPETGRWAQTNFKILRATAAVPRPGAENLVTYWAKRGTKRTRYAEIS